MNGRISDKNLLEDIQIIKPEDTLSQFVEKCNNNFNIIKEKGGGKQGIAGPKGDQGSPTKPKVPIHIWKKGEQYESETKIGETYTLELKEDLNNTKYQEGHLIIIENANVYKLTIDKININNLTPEYIFSLYPNGIEQIKNDINNNIDEFKNNTNKLINDFISNFNNGINKLKIGGINLIDRTSFEIYPGENPNYYILTKDSNIKNFDFMNRNIKNGYIKIKDKNIYNKDNISTNSLLIDAQDNTLINTSGDTNYCDVIQSLKSVLKPNRTYILQCKYKCANKTNDYKYCGGLYITNSNACEKYVYIDGEEIENKTTNIPPDLETRFIEPTDVWKEIIIKFKTDEMVGKDAISLYIRAMRGCSIEICELKLEEGDFPTTWSPSLNDNSFKIFNNISIGEISNLYLEKPNDNTFGFDMNNFNYNADNIIIKKSNEDFSVILPTEKSYVYTKDGDVYKKTEIEDNNNIGRIIRIKNLSGKKCSVKLTEGTNYKLYSTESTTNNSIDITNSYFEFVCFNGNNWCQVK